MRRGCELQSADRTREVVAASGEHDEKLSGSTKDEAFLNQLSGFSRTNQLLGESSSSVNPQTGRPRSECK